MKALAFAFILSSAATSVLADPIRDTYIGHYSQLNLSKAIKETKTANGTVLLSPYVEIHDSLAYGLTFEGQRYQLNGDARTAAGLCAQLGFRKADGTGALLGYMKQNGVFGINAAVNDKNIAFLAENGAFRKEDKQYVLLKEVVCYKPTYTKDGDQILGFTSFLDEYKHEQSTVTMDDGTTVFRYPRATFLKATKESCDFSVANCASFARSDFALPDNTAIAKKVCTSLGKTYLSHQLVDSGFKHRYLRLMLRADGRFVRDPSLNPMFRSPGNGAKIIESVVCR